MISKINVFRGGVRIVAGVMVLWLLLQERSEVNDAVLITAAVLTLSCVVFFFEKIEAVAAINEIGISAALSALFTCQISLSELYSAPFMQDARIFIKIFVALVIFANVFFVVFYLYTRLQQKSLQVSSSAEKSPIYSVNTASRNKKGLILCKLAIVGETLLYLFSTFPGIWLQSDAAGVYYAATEETWNAWHTIGYVWFVRLCTFIWESPFIVNIVQSIFWVVLNFYIIEILHRKSLSAVYLYTISVCVISVPFLYLENLGKDTVFSIGILALSALLYSAIQNGTLSKKELVYFSAFPLLALLCRHGGEIPVLFSCIAAAIYFVVKKNKKMARNMWILVAWFAFAYFLVNVVLTQVLNVTKNPSYVKYSTPMAMVGAAVAQDVQFSENDIEILERIMPLEDWGSCYNRYWADDISRGWGKIGPEAIDRLAEEVEYNGFGKELLRINLKLLIQHPVIYLNALFDMNSIMWEFARPEGTPIHFVAMVPEDGQIRYSAAYIITSEWTQFLDSFVLTRALITRGGFSLFVLLFCAVFLFQCKKRLIIPFFPIGLVYLMLSISIPAQDPRYILPALECAILFSAIVFSKVHIKKKAEN